MAPGRATILVKAAVGLLLALCAYWWFSSRLNYIVRAPEALQREIAGEVFTRPFDLRAQHTTWTMDGGTGRWTYVLSPENRAKVVHFCRAVRRSHQVGESRGLGIDISPGECRINKLTSPDDPAREQRIGMVYFAATGRLEVWHDA